VNAAIHLRRPLLITGFPGSGKTKLASAIAYELQLGLVLDWPITAGSTVQDALYRSDLNLPNDLLNLFEVRSHEIGLGGKINVGGLRLQNPQIIESNRK
jgi:MoxR-like ATPase